MILQASFIPKKTFIGYIFHFGFPKSNSFQDFQTFCNSDNLFNNFASGFLNIKEEIIATPKNEKDPKVRDVISSNKSQFLEAFKMNAKNRMNLQFRNLRNTYIIELNKFSISHIFIDDNKVDVGQETTLSGLILIHKFGIASVILWLEDFHPKTPIEWLSTRNPQKIVINLNTLLNEHSKWRLTHLVRYFVCLTQFQLSKSNLPSIIKQSIFESDYELNSFLGTSIKSYENKFHNANLDIDDYPIYFLQYDIDNDLFKNIFNNPDYIKGLRIPLYGDKNWHLKSRTVNDTLLEKADTSTRDSIKWLISSTGTLKICSNNFGTSLEESFTATILETDLILSMKFLLKRADALAAEFFDTEKNMVKYDQKYMLGIKYQLFQDFNNYCQLGVYNSESTRRRIEKCKKIFEIDSIYRSVTDRFDLIGSLYSVIQSNNNSTLTEQQTELAVQQTKLNNQQLLLALIFGIFASFDASYGVLSNSFPNFLWLNFLISLLVSLSTIIIINKYFNK